MSESPLMDVRAIKEVLPHRYPFLLVDRVLELEPFVRVKAIKNVTANEEFFNGHFPGQPVMPGVLILEALAQAGGVMMLRDDPERADKLMLFTGVEKARFRRPVVPGDQLVLEVETLQHRRNHCRLDARALVDGKVAAQAVLMSATVAR